MAVIIYIDVSGDEGHSGKKGISSGAASMGGSFCLADDIGIDRD